MRYSRLFGSTVRNIPASTKLVSHKLLYKGGYIREIAAGRYTLLPLGARVYQKVVQIIDNRMTELGSQRVFTPTMHPKAIWQKTGRDKVWGKGLMTVKDERTNQEFALAATGEGLFTEMVKEFKPSYRDLPIYLHQFSQKFRNEKRARGGLVRIREFLMKDAYSFDADATSFAETYKLFYNSYEQIARDLSIEVIPVEADNGALGGDYSHEFMVLADYGEDRVIQCDSCGYSANMEKAVFIREEVNKDEEIKEYKVAPLPAEVGTIKELVAHYNLPAERFIKNVVYKTDEGKIIIATVVGNLDVNETKLSRVLALNGDLEVATDEDLASFGAKSGYVHSWGYDDPRIIYVADESVVKARNLYGGYKTETTDPINVNYSRDFKADVVGDIVDTPEGAKCARCDKGTLRIKRAIEFGHVFSYGDFYSKPHNATYTDKSGKNQYLLMGAYGIGVERTMAIIVEAHHDEKGIIWPEQVAPFKYHLIGLDQRGLDVYDRLLGEKIEVLFDDRDVSAGEKFADADLIGCPIRLVVSKKTSDKVEVKKRDEAGSLLISVDQLLES
ncbi:MAG: Proline-tRNA ligase [Microgenomates group bacterium GW2011_GWA2_44_7]|nr:MAG: Proline-tRNA ligase [Microgenomates group bacterium GW2011_GWA2_44_7]